MYYQILSYLSEYKMTLPVKTTPFTTSVLSKIPTKNMFNFLHNYKEISHFSHKLGEKSPLYIWVNTVFHYVRHIPALHHKAEEDQTK
jgi:hypothetical protein